VPHWLEDPDFVAFLGALDERHSQRGVDHAA
jgi:hypothetical protein